MTKAPRGHKGRKAKSNPAMGRSHFEKVKSAKGRKLSSTLWLQRQLNDPYVAEANRRGFRSRAAFKIIELNEKYKFIKSGSRVVDLGAAPGGWSQITVDIVGHKGCVIALDIQEMEALPGVVVLHQDFMEDEAPDLIKAELKGEADVVMSDMAAPATGHASTDHLRIMALAETAYHFAREVLAPNGVFLAKVLQGGAEGNLLNTLKHDFKTVRHVKPAASRQDSAEMYVIAIGFRAHKKAGDPD